MLACQTKQVVSEKTLWLNFCWLVATWDAEQDSRIWRPFQHKCCLENLFISDWWTIHSNETESNWNCYIFHYTKQPHTKKCWAISTRGEWSCRKYPLLGLYHDLCSKYNTATIMITIRHLGKKWKHGAINLTIFLHFVWCCWSKGCNGAKHLQVNLNQPI